MWTNYYYSLKGFPYYANILLWFATDYTTSF